MNPLGKHLYLVGTGEEEFRATVFQTAGPVNCRRFLGAYPYSDPSGKNGRVGLYRIGNLPNQRQCYRSPSQRQACANHHDNSESNVKGQGKDGDVAFPSDEEIRLVITQAERAVDQYKPLLDQEQQMLGKEGAEAVTKDREVVAGLELAIKGFGKNPQAFNGPLGFDFF